MRPLQKYLGYLVKFSLEKYQIETLGLFFLFQFDTLCAAIINLTSLQKFNINMIEKLISN